MANAPIALVVDASDQQIAHLKNCLSDWECVIVPVNDQGIAYECSTPTPPMVAILYAQDEVNSTLAICEQLRTDPNTTSTALLLAISRYEISQGNVVRSLENADFIFTPFDQDELNVRIDRLLDVR